MPISPTKCHFVAKINAIPMPNSYQTLSQFLQEIQSADAPDGPDAPDAPAGNVNQETQVHVISHYVYGTYVFDE